MLRFHKKIGSSSSPRVESPYSEKVRCTLFMKVIDLIAYDVDISVQEHYKPAYAVMWNIGRGNQSLSGEHDLTIQNLVPALSQL